MLAEEQRQGDRHESELSENCPLKLPLGLRLGGGDGGWDLKNHLLAPARRTLGRQEWKWL